MRVLRAGVDPEAFFRRLGSSPDRILMLDYDGTLAPFTEARDEAVPFPGMREAVESIVAAGHTRVIVVSGRALNDLRPLLGVRPEPEMWGSHGWERYRPETGVERADPGADPTRRLARAVALARARAPRGSVEVKPASVAVHVRGIESDAADSLLSGIRADWSDLAGGSVLKIHEFDGGLELRVPGRDKGTSVRAVLEDAGEETAAAFLGDDRTDEDAFAALGGRGLSVLVRSELRETLADVWIRPPEELLEFLERWNRAAAEE